MFVASSRWSKSDLCLLFPSVPLRKNGGLRVRKHLFLAFSVLLFGFLISTSPFTYSPFKLMSEIRGLMASHCPFHSDRFPLLPGVFCCWQSWALFFASGLLRAQALPVSPRSLCPCPGILGTSCPCPSQHFPSQTKASRVVFFITFLHGIPASTSPTCLSALSSSITSV